MRWMRTARGRLIVAALVGIMSGAMAWRELAAARGRIEGRYRLSTVLRAKKYIPAGKPVTADVVEAVEIPDTFRQPNALSDAKEVQPDPSREPLRARVGFLKGEQIARSKLYDARGVLGLAWSVPADRIAMTLRLAPENAVGGLVRPGDRVSVFCTRSQGTSARSEVLFRSVRVAAVGDRVWNPDAPFDTKEAGERIETDAILVTLVLTVRDAALASSASENGRVSLALRSALDESDPEETPVGLTPIGRTSSP